MAENRSQRTEQPTSRKLEKARKDGKVPRTQELSGALALGAFLVFCHLFGNDWLERLQGLVRGSLSEPLTGDLDPMRWMAIVRQLATTTSHLVLLPVGLVAAASLAGNVLQSPPVISFKPLKPKPSKFDPIQGLRKVLSLRSLVSLSKALVKMTLFATVAVLAVRDAFVQGLPGAPGAEGALAAIFAVVGKVLFRVVLLWLGIALIDLLYTRFQHTRDLRMTKQEVKDERKQLEGDPLIKAKIRAKQFEMGRARMMADVPDATVVVTNPTHVAVALRYVPGETGVPQVLAKGRALLAERIRHIAAEHHVPIVQDAPLARALYRSVPVGAHVPEALYRAVAEVLALVLRGSGRDGGREARP